MLELCAIGPEPDQRWRRRITHDAMVRLGRAPVRGWAVPWDLRISREHADLSFEGDRLFVACLPTARNPAYYQGRSTEKFAVQPGEEFRIGLTTFRLELVAAPVGGPQAPQQEEAKDALQEQILKARVGAGQTSARGRRSTEDELRAVLEFFDQEAPPPVERPRSERDTDSTSAPEAGTATPGSLLARIAAEQQADREARLRAEREAQQHKSEAKVLRLALEKLRSQIKREMDAREEAAERVEELEAEGERASVHEAAHQRAQNDADRSQAEAARLRDELEQLQKQMQHEIEQIQQAEAEATRVALQEARKTAEVEAEARAQQLVEEKTQELAAALARARQEAERLAAQDAERQREEEQRRRADEEALRKAEEEAERVREEADELRRRFVELERELEKQAAAQRTADQRMQELLATEAQRKAEEDQRRQRDAELLRQAEARAAQHQAEAENLRRVVEGLQDRLQSAAEEEARAKQEVLRYAEAEARWRQEEEKRRQAEEAARAAQSAEAERRRQEAEALKNEVAQLQQALQDKAEAQRQADLRAQQMAAEEEKRRRAEEAQRRADQEARLQLERESERRREEAQHLKSELERLASELQQKISAQQESEQRTGKLTKQLKSEADTLKAQLQRLQKKAEQEAAEQRAAEEQLRKLVEAEEQRIEQERARRIAEQQARQRAEEEARKRQTELDELRGEMISLQERWQEQLDAQKRAEQAVAQLALDEAKRRAEEGERRRKAEEARRRAEEMAARHQADVERLRSEVGALQKQLRDEASAHEFAISEAERIAQEETRRREQEIAREQSELMAKHRVELEAAEQQERSRSLRQDIEQVKSKIQAAEQKRAAIRRKQQAAVRRQEELPVEFDPYYRWLAIPPDEQPADYYRLLGVVRFEDDWEVIERSADRQMAYVRMHQLGKYARECQKVLNELAAAKVTLLDPDKKKAYDDQLLAELEGDDLGLPEEESSEVELDPGVADGAAFKEYLLLDYVASGETGQMFYARHRTLGRRVALNVLSEAAGQDEETVKRFRRKSQILACWHHANLVPVYDAGQQDGFHYLVMEYVDGCDLLTLLKHRDLLPVTEALELIRQAACGLAFLHENGVIHRNVSPRNLLIDTQSRVKLIGLGQALYTKSCPLGEVNASTDANSEQAIGSFDYMAPEQALHCGRVDARADIYSLGCTLFTALTKQVVFADDQPSLEAVSQRGVPSRRLSDLRDDVPPQLDAIFEKMVAADRDDRYESMDQVVEALDEVLRNQHHS